MSRPTYQSTGDLEREDDVRAMVMMWGKCDAVRTPTHAAIDIIMHREQTIVAVAEIKCRGNTMLQYPDYSIGHQKMLNLQMTGELLCVPALLVVRWSCGALGYIDASTKPIALQEGGREDRNDPKDQEIMAHYDLQDFRDVRIQTA
jgi:hypothetical protein